MPESLLAINGGSSSLKLGLFTDADPPRLRLEGQVARIGLPDSELRLLDGGRERVLEDRTIEAPDHRRAVKLLLDRVEEHVDLSDVRAVGHRVVHGGDVPDAARPVTDALLRELAWTARVDPDHVPMETGLIHVLARRLPGVPQVACFDTTFHRDLPRVARLLPLPRRYAARGIRRYGFHGLSYAWILEELERLDGREAARGRLVLAHLGSGASMAAVHEGRCVDTTMSFSPASGLVMAKRSGDLDPGVLVYLLREERLDADALEELVERRSGLLGVSGRSPDMRDLLAAAPEHPAAEDAVALFCHSARRWIGALAAELGGVDTLVFSGGIGEHAPAVRARICERLGFLGIHVDPGANERGAGRISPSDAPVTVRVVPSDEQAMIARYTRAVLAAAAGT